MSSTSAAPDAATETVEPCRRSSSAPHAFSVMWTAASFSFCGDGLILAAAPLAAATLTSDPLLISGITVAATLPWALFCLVSGAVVDRLDRIRLMWRIDLLRAVVMAVPALAFMVDSANIYLLIASFFLLGTAETFFTNAAQAALPSVVPEQGLRSANGKLQSAELVLTQLVGPLLGGLLFAVAAALPFVVNSASFLFSAVLLLLIRRRQTVAPLVRAAQPLRRQIAEGLGWLWRHSQLRALALLIGLVNMLTEATLSILVIFTVNDLGAAAASFGYLLAIEAIGGVLASVVGPTLSSRLDDRATLLAVLAIQSVTQLVIFFTSSLIVVGTALALAAFGIVIWRIITVSLRQEMVPDHMLGRVNSVYRLVSWGTIPIGAACGGLLAATVGTRVVFLVGGLLLGAVAILAVFILNAGLGQQANR
jgi:MFS family permease